MPPFFYIVAQHILRYIGDSLQLTYQLHNGPKIINSIVAEKICQTKQQNLTVV